MKCDIDQDTESYGEVNLDFKPMSYMNLLSSCQPLIDHIIRSQATSHNQKKEAMADEVSTKDEEDVFARPDFRVTSAVLYHPDLLRFDENTKLSGTGQPSPFYMFQYHQWRMIEAIKEMPGNTEAMLEAILGPSGLESIRLVAIRAVGNGPTKLRFTIGCQGKLDCTSMDLGGSPMPLDVRDCYPTTLPDPGTVRGNAVTWLVSVCSWPVKAQFTTRHKTNRREHYDRAIRQAPSADSTHRVEVLVFNERYQIMEGCSTTPYFWRDGRWVTPHASCGGNRGTTRRWALDNKLASEGFIMKNEIQPGEIILLSNGVRAFGFGKVVKV